jgi:hypothetical protein
LASGTDPTQRLTPLAGLWHRREPGVARLVQIVQRCLASSTLWFVVERRQGFVVILLMLCQRGGLLYRGVM